MGEPAGVGFFLAASEQPTDAQRLARIGADVAESAAPFLPAPWGQILTAAGALGLGVVGERRVRKASDSAWDEAKADEAMRRGSA